MTKTKKETMTLWSNFCDFNLADWAEYFEDAFPDEELDDTTKWDIIYDTLRNDLEELRDGLDYQLDDEIICVGTVGRWNGSVSGYKIIESGNIADCFYDNCCDYCEWYCDKYNLKFRGAHHDGRNSYLYRVWKDGLSNEQKDNFLDKLYYGKATSKDITRYTKSIRPYIAEIFGW